MSENQSPLDGKKAKEAAFKSPYKRLIMSDKVGKKPCYELIFLLRSDVSPQDVKVFFERLTGIFSTFNQSISKCDYLGMRLLAYRIKKNKKAHFYRIQYYGDLPLNTEIERVFKISDSVLRHLFIRLNSFDERPAPLVANITEDIENGFAVFDEKYVMKI